ncbi:MAG: 2-dehydropantoate 2-reductase [Peptococcaceae bacterium]|nr:2-dehydropantoate 2-reductase [Peptococcaceae bacterium]
MKYLVIGAGGTGAILGAQLIKGGQDVTLIARGAHLAAMTEHGLYIDRVWNGTEETVPVKACTMEDYSETPDVILVCVKGYSIPSVVPFIARVAGPETVVIPVLNIYGTGAKLQAELPDVDVLDGCVYLYAEISAPGKILQSGPYCRLVFGPRDHDIAKPCYEQIAAEFAASGIKPELTAHIQRDALQKFSYVSPVGATGLYFNACAEAMQKEGEAREFFKGMVREIADLSVAMDCAFDHDVVPDDLKILDGITPQALTSMQRDIADGHASEIDGLIYEVVRLGEQYHVDVPLYKKVAEEMKRRGL